MSRYHSPIQQLVIAANVMRHEPVISHVPLRPRVTQFSFRLNLNSTIPSEYTPGLSDTWRRPADESMCLKARAHCVYVCACERALGPWGTCERGEGEGGERAPVGFSLSRALWLCRGATLQRRHALPCVHVLQLRVHTCHLRMEGDRQPVSTQSLLRVCFESPLAFHRPNVQIGGNSKSV